MPTSSPGDCNAANSNLEALAVLRKKVTDTGIISVINFALSEMDNPSSDMRGIVTDIDSYSVTVDVTAERFHFAAESDRTPFSLPLGDVLVAILDAPAVE